MIGTPENPWGTPWSAEEPDLCGCRTCVDHRVTHLPPEIDYSDRLFSSTASRFIICGVCGNKRCPHATDHRLECTDSNDTGQSGSAYEFQGAFNAAGMSVQEVADAILVNAHAAPDPLAYVDPKDCRLCAEGL